jgi:arylformamidase
MSKVIDISVRLEDGMPTWPGSVGFHRHDAMRIADGDPANVSRVDLDVHSGTHVEAPLHFLEDGLALDDIPLDTFVGPAIVADLRGVRAIGAAQLESAGLPPGTERVLIRTDNSPLWAHPDRRFRTDYVGLTADGARWVADRGIRLVGIDYLSIQRYEDDFETHRILLRAGTVILEGLDLGSVDAGPYELSCLPVRIADAEAAPVRAVLYPAGRP